jgi:hypothetical protein
MAIEVLSNLSSALSQVFEAQLARQWNRMAVTAQLIEAERGRGKNVAWDVEFSGNSAGSVAEGSDVATSEFATDVVLPATLSWATYRSSFLISELEVDAAAGSQGSADALLDIFGEKMLGANAKLISTINADIFAGTGTDGSGNPNIVGLWGGALDPTGTYAGIVRGTYTEFAGNQLANSSVARALTQDLLYQMEANIFTACGESPSVIVTSPGVVRKYAGLFESQRVVMTDGAMPSEFAAGTSNMSWRGMPVIRDRNAPSGKLLMLNKNYLKMKYLPHFMVDEGTPKKMETLTGSNGMGVSNATRIPARLVILAKTGDSYKASLKTVLQLAVTHPNTCGELIDLSEV